MLKFWISHVLFGMMCIMHTAWGVADSICIHASNVYLDWVLFLLDVDSQYSRYLAAAAMNDTSTSMYRSFVQQGRVGNQCLFRPFMALRFSKAEHPHLTWILTLSFSCWHMCIVYQCLVAIICILLCNLCGFYLGICFEWIIRSEFFLLGVDLEVLNLVHSISSNGCDEWHKNIHLWLSWTS